MDAPNIAFPLNVRCVYPSLQHACRRVLAVCALIWPVVTFAISDNDFYQTGWAFYQAGHYTEAGRLWQAQAHNPADDEEGKRQAALAAVLASKAWEQVGTTHAYAAWADAIRLYLEANTTWEQERLRLADQIALAKAALQQATSTPTIEPFLQLLLAIDSKSALADYNGPRLGLRDRDNAAEPALDLSVNYLMAPANQASAESESVLPVIDHHPPAVLTLIEQDKINNEQQEQENSDAVRIEPGTAEMMIVPDTIAPTNIENLIVEPGFSGHVIPFTEDTLPAATSVINIRPESISVSPSSLVVPNRRSNRKKSTLAQ